MSIDFRKFDSKVELDVQRELFQECFPECIDTPVISKDHYHWKFHSKKGEMKSAEFTANSEDGILGYYSAIPYQYRFSGKVVNAAMVCDVMTGVKARGKGIFTKLGVYSTAEFAKLGFDFTTGYPIRKEVIPGHIKAGWEINFELPLYGRFIKFNSFLKKKKLEFLAPIFNLSFDFVTRVLNFILLPRNSKLKLETYTSDSIESITGLVEFYSAWGNEIEISLIKDLNFLKWRLGAPEKSYFISVLRYENKIVGVIIAREVLKEGVPCMGVLDIALLKTHHKYANLLTNEIIEVAKKHNLELLLVMISKSWFKKYKLSQNIFIKSPFKFYLIIKQLNAAINSSVLKNEKNWHLMWIDSDDL
jgi:hypothetical protein